LDPTMMFSECLIPYELTIEILIDYRFLASSGSPPIHS
jgi:hypothetical protein